MILARDMQLNVFNQAVEKLGGALVTILARDLRLTKHLEMLRGALGTILAAKFAIEQVVNNSRRWCE